VIDAADVRRHLLKLSAANLGRDAISAASDVFASIIDEIRTGKRKRIRARTARQLLAVNESCISDGALLPAAKTWTLLDQLLGEGYKAATISRELGFKSRAIQISRVWVRADTAARVKRLHARLHGNKAAVESQLSRLEKLRRQPAVIVHRLEDDE
jgi:hypothetical protein